MALISEFCQVNCFYTLSELNFACINFAVFANFDYFCDKLKGFTHGKKNVIWYIESHHNSYYKSKILLSEMSTSKDISI